MNRQLIAFLAGAALMFGNSAQAAVLPFTEHFATDNADWKNVLAADLSYVAAGGPDGSSYVSDDFSFVSSTDGDTPVLFRGQDDFGSSGGAFEGDWATDGIRHLSAWVRHDSPVLLNYFTRFSGPFNFPGATALVFTPVLPNVWTKLEFDLYPTSSQFITFEGTDWISTFSNVGHLQLGVSVPASLAGGASSFNFDLDQVAIAAPEPTTLLLGMLGSMLAFGRRSRRGLA